MKQQSMGYWLLGVGLIALLLVGCVAGAALMWGWTALRPFPRLAVSTPSLVPTPMLPRLPPPSNISATDLETQIEAVYQHAGASVVNITSRSFEYDFFFNPVPREGSGSGFFFDTQGHIVTNYHVISKAEEIQVSLVDGQSIPAQIVGVDPSNDLAVLKVNLPAEQIVSITFGDSAQVRIGQFVVAVGNPFGLERTLTFGVVSSLGRVIESPDQRFIGEVIQTDAPINPGNSGGPLFDLRGTVIGVNTAILSPSGASAGIGFAIPSRTVQRVVPVLIAEGRYPHPSLDARLFELTPQWADLLRRAGMNVPVERGLLVIEAGSTHSNSGSGLRGGQQLVRIGNIRVPVGGDIITAINGQSLMTNRDLIAFLGAQTEVGQVVEVTIIRDGKEQNIALKLQEEQR